MFAELSQYQSKVSPVGTVKSYFSILLSHVMDLSYMQLENPLSKCFCQVYFLICLSSMFMALTTKSGAISEYLMVYFVIRDTI